MSLSSVTGYKYCNVCVILSYCIIIVYIGLICFSSQKYQYLYDQDDIDDILIENFHINYSYDECSSVIDSNTIHFMNEKELETKFRYNYPPLLFSFGGSGNTMTRLLIEYITNIWSGSIYNDTSLRNHGFKGEYICLNVSVVKVHPEHIIPLKFNHNHQNIDWFLVPCVGNTYLKRFGNKQIKFDNMSAIFIIRNPWKAWFTMLLLEHGDDAKTQMKHISQLKIEIWDKNKDGFCSFIRRKSKFWLQTFKMMHLMTQFGHKYITLKFENLVESNLEIAIKETNKIAKYLLSDKYYQQNQEFIIQQINCIQQVLMQSDYDRFGIMHRRKENPQMYLTYDRAYQFAVETCPSIICKVWQRVEKYAIQYGYTLLPTIICN